MADFFGKYLLVAAFAWLVTTLAGFGLVGYLIYAAASFLLRH